jgi:hypothetical protein
MMERFRICVHISLPRESAKSLEFMLPAVRWGDPVARSLRSPSNLFMLPNEGSHSMREEPSTPLCATSCLALVAG